MTLALVDITNGRTLVFEGTQLVQQSRRSFYGNLFVFAPVDNEQWRQDRQKVGVVDPDCVAPVGELKWVIYDGYRVVVEVGCTR